MLWQKLKKNENKECVNQNVLKKETKNEWKKKKIAWTIEWKWRVCVYQKIKNKKVTEENWCMTEMTWPTNSFSYHLKFCLVFFFISSSTRFSEGHGSVDLQTVSSQETPAHSYVYWQPCMHLIKWHSCIISSFFSFTFSFAY